MEIQFASVTFYSDMITRVTVTEASGNGGPVIRIARAPGIVCNPRKETVLRGIVVPRGKVVAIMASRISRRHRPRLRVAGQRLGHDGRSGILWSKQNRTSEHPPSAPLEEQKMSGSRRGPVVRCRIFCEFVSFGTTCASCPSTLQAPASRSPWIDLPAHPLQQQVYCAYGHCWPSLSSFSRVFWKMGVK